MQKALKYTLVLILFSLTITAQHKGPIKWLTIEQADSLYKIEKRPMFIDVYTDWCGWCKRMDKGTFMDPSIAAYLNMFFYPVKLNAEMNDTVTFNGKEYTNSQGVKAQEMVSQYENEITSLKDSVEILKKKGGDFKAMESEVEKKSRQLFNFKRRARKTTHDVAIDLCQGKMSYPTFIILFNDLQANLPLKGYQQPNDLLSYLAFINEGVWRSSRNAGGYNRDFKEAYGPDSLLKKESITWVSLEQALELSKKDKRKILVHVINPNSISSNMMDKVSFRDLTTADKINKNFHSVKIYTNEKKDIVFKGQTFKNIGGIHQLAGALTQNKLVFPNTTFLDEKGDLIMRVPQYFEPKAIDPVLDYFLDEGYKKGTFADWKSAKEKAAKSGK